MAIAAAWQTIATIAGSSNTFYTVPSGTAASYGTYARDLVVTNGGPSTAFISLATSGTSAVTANASFAIPTGGTVILTQCQVPANAVVGVGTGSGTATVSLGFGTNVSYV